MWVDLCYYVIYLFTSFATLLYSPYSPHIGSFGVSFIFLFVCLCFVLCFGWRGIHLDELSLDRHIDQYTSYLSIILFYGSYWFSWLLIFCSLVCSKSLETSKWVLVFHIQTEECQFHRLLYTNFWKLVVESISFESKLLFFHIYHG